MMYLDSRLARLIATLLTASLINLTVPYAAIRASADATAAAKPKVQPKKAMPASRLLTKKEMADLRGMTVANPYLAGSQKWDVIYNGVNLMTGNFTTSATDLSFEGGYGIPVNITRSYSANNPDEGPFGVGWTLSVDIRTTAGGLLKSAGAPSHSVPTQFKERPLEQIDPNLGAAINQPVEAVLATDAGGKEETMQRDVDGVITPPAWDHNITEPTYETVTDANGNVSQILVAQTVLTPEGTEYRYSAHGEYGYFDSQQTWVPGMTTGEPSNILKIDYVRDRHGNQTDYTYGGYKTFHKANGWVTEAVLAGIVMPGGHALSFGWHSTASRLLSVTDNGSSPRTVSYGYSDGDHLTSVTSPGGKTTNYGYAPPTNLPGPEWFLSSITDPRGMTSTVSSAYYGEYYTVNEIQIASPRPTGVRVESISSPNGATDAFVYEGGQRQITAFFTSVPNVTVTRSMPDHPDMAHFAVVGPFLATNGAIDVQMRDYHRYDPQWNPTAGPNCAWEKQYDQGQNLIVDIQRISSYPMLSCSEGDLSSGRAMNVRSFDFQLVTTDSSYNFLGQPLEKVVTEQDSPVSTPTTRTARTLYSYWGGNKYFQQKATKDDAGRVSLTDYYTDSEQGRGQVKCIYDQKYGQPFLTDPTNATPDEWRHQVSPPANEVAPDDNTTVNKHYSAYFKYDSAGRPTDVWKVRTANTANTTYTYVHTTTGYNDSTGWGSASVVTEDAGGINRITRTLEFDGSGRATKVQDAAGKQFLTDYNADGQVQTVYRVDPNHNDLIVQYVYGDSGIVNGVPIYICDGLSMVEQSFAYYPASAAAYRRGQLQQQFEITPNGWNTVDYDYNDTGDRDTVDYYTWSDDAHWRYSDYINVGDPSSSSRVFQTLSKTNYNANPALRLRTEEECHYSFDTAGRLNAAAFAQQPELTERVDGSFYTTDNPALSRALTAYTYDPVGRVLDVSTYWQVRSGGTYTTSNVAKNNCQYELTYAGGSSTLNRGLKSKSDYYLPNSNGAFVRVEAQEYGYDNKLDTLVAASYVDYNLQGQQTGSSSNTWSYDAAGNRANTSYTYDSLNRMQTSPSCTYQNDILGNRTHRANSGGDTGYLWDDLNRMTSYTVSGTIPGNPPIVVVPQTHTYTYRADGMRVTKISNWGAAYQLPEGESGTWDPNLAENLPTTRYLYDGQMVAMEDYSRYEGGTAMKEDLTRYGLGAKGIDVVERKPAGGSWSTSFPIYDAHGNNIASLSRGTSAGTYLLTNRRSYDAWGVVRSQQNGGTPSQRYCANLGHVQDDESGLIYMRARYYEPGTGRFISEDPAQDGGNWYIYCVNDPVNYADQTGKSPIAEFLTACLLLLVGGLLLGLSADLDSSVTTLKGIIRLYTPRGAQWKFSKQFESILKEAARLREGPTASKGQSARAALATSIMGYLFLIQAFLLMIDLAVTDLPDPLALFWGGDSK